MINAHDLTLTLNNGARLKVLVEHEGDQTLYYVGLGNEMTGLSRDELEQLHANIGHMLAARL